MLHLGSTRKSRSARVINAVAEVYYALSRRIRLNAPNDPLSRLARLITAAAPDEPSATPVSDDPATAQLRGVRTERMAQVMAELRARTESHIDPVEAAVMQILLKDYRAAVAHLRTVARHTEQRLATVAATFKEGTRLLTTPAISREPNNAPKHVT
jgi:hypothetical protein